MSRWRVIPSFARILEALKMEWFIKSTVILIIFSLSSTTTSADDNPYRHWESLDPRGRYILEWVVDWKEERVVFNVTAATRGYVGFGISRRGGLAGADIVIGGVDRNGKPYFTDRHARQENQVPALDPSQDWVLHEAWENYTHTFLSFSRPFDTCDEEHDIVINGDALSLLYALGKKDKPSKYDFNNRNVRMVYLRDPELTPRIIKQNPDARSSELSGRRVSVWSVRRDLTLPSKRTTYFCDIHKLSLPRKHHIMGFNVRINSESLQNTHHIFLFRCNMPSGISPTPVFDRFVNQTGEECYTPTDEIGTIPTQYCTELKVGNAIGGYSLFFPDHVGIPIGDTGPDEYFLFQVHYDNPDERSDILVNIQMDIFYTPDLRENDAGVISLGQDIPGSPSILIPPNSADHTLYGHCSSSCTAKMFPKEGIKIVSALLHSHNAGTRIRFHHFRDGKELPWISNDDNYMFQFQPSRLLRNEVQILPGDHLALRCVYDTSTRNGTTVGGYSTEEEMCHVFILYYNRLPQYPICRSELVSPEYVRRYLAGARNLTWNQSQLEFVATAPPHLAGMTVSQIADSAYVNWTEDLRTQLQRDHIIHPQVEICPSVTEAAAAILLGQTLPPRFVSFPTQIPQYQPPQICA